MAVLAGARRRVVGQAGPVVAHDEHRTRPLTPDRHLDVAGRGMRPDVAQPFLACAEQQPVHGRTVSEGIVHLQRDVDALRRETRREVGERLAEAFGVEVRWIDPDDHGAERPHARPNGLGGIPQRRRPIRIAVAGGLGRQMHREPGQLLDRPVVQIGGDPASLSVGELDRLLEQTRAVGGRALEPSRQAPRQRDQQDGERRERHQQHRCERRQEVPFALSHARGTLQDLEQQGLPAPGGHRGERIQQRARVGQVRVLWGREVRGAHLDLPTREPVEAADRTRVALADQRGPVGVGVHDVAFRRPQANAHDGVVQHRVGDDRRHAHLGFGIDPHDRVLDPRFDDRCGVGGEVARVRHRLLRRHPAQHDHTHHPDQDQHDEAERDEHEHGPQDGVGATSSHGADATRAAGRRNRRSAAFAAGEAEVPVDTSW